MRMLTLGITLSLLATFAIVAIGCGGKATATNDKSDLKSTSTSGGEGFASTDGGGSSTPLATPPTPEATFPGTTPEAGEAGVTDYVSNRRVTFRVTNTGTKVVYLAGLSRGCTVYSVEGLDGHLVPQLVWSDPPSCHGGGNWGYLDTFQRMAPGDSQDTVWDATQVVATTSNGCQVGNTIPVAPGSYRVNWGYELSPPAGCAEDSTRSDLWYCADRPGLTDDPVYAPLCPTGGVVTTEFVLPPPPVVLEAGDTTLVEVSVNAQ